MLLLPTVIGSWTLARKLGSDGPVDRLAATSAEGRPALARRVDADKLHDPGRLAAVAARARDVLGVRHPSIVPAIDLLQDGSSTVLIEEAPDAVGLDRVLDYLRATGEALPAHIFLHIATQICNALEALHGRPSPAAGADQLLHLGLRPQAVLVSREGRVRLGRLALIPGVGPLPGEDADETTLEYLAPEQTGRMNRAVDARADLYALGATLYALFSGRAPFVCADLLEYVHAHLAREPIALSAEAPELPRQAAEIVMTLLRKRPEERYQSAAGMFPLRRWRRRSMASSPTRSPRPTTPSTPGAPGCSPRWAPTAGCSPIWSPAPGRCWARSPRSRSSAPPTSSCSPPRA